MTRLWDYSNLEVEYTRELTDPPGVLNVSRCKLCGQKFTACSTKPRHLSMKQLAYKGIQEKFRKHVEGRHPELIPAEKGPR